MAMEHKNAPGQAIREFGADCAHDVAVGSSAMALSHGEPWSGILSDAGPRDHIVQLYQDQQFLNRAVCRFAAAALANGEGVILVPTVQHWNAFRPRLVAEGI